jgi:hypothetical protein
MIPYGRAAAALLTATLMLVCPGMPAVSAQQPPSLAEIAKKEADRRRALKVEGKVYTNKDLPKSANPAQPSSTSPAPAATAEQKAAAQKPAEAPPSDKDKQAEKDKDKEEEKDEAWWRKRITAARDALQRTELAADAFQSRINALTTDFVNRDDPYQRAQISIERQKALNELERVKADIVRIKQQIAEIEEEARVAGVPPGWLR